MLLKIVRNLVNFRTVKHTFFVRADSIASPPYTNWHIFEKVRYGKVPYGYGQTFVIKYVGFDYPYPINDPHKEGKIILLYSVLDRSTNQWSIFRSILEVKED
jgi:hypothetical protein